MNAALYIDPQQLQKLLAAANPDAALLFLYIQSGNDATQAVSALHLTEKRYNYAAATLRQLGLWPEEKRVILPAEERPNYTATDVLRAMDRDVDFKSLYGEVQRQLGRVLNTEELKILLGFVRYLGLPTDVISVLVCYCKERARQKGSSRNPSLRTIEKEAFAWAEQGIDTLEEAAAFIQNQNLRRSRLARLMQLLQIRGRNLTAGEERYAQQWLDWGFEEDAIALAYERTCLNTGGLSWAYMHKILTRWQEAGLLTLQQIQSGDRKTPAKGATGHLGQEELDAIARVLQEA